MDNAFCSLLNHQGRITKSPKCVNEIFLNVANKPFTSIATLTEGCTSSIILLERARFASIAELLRESFKSVSMVPVAMATGDAAMVACSLCGGEGGAVKEFSEDCPHNKNLKIKEK